MELIDNGREPLTRLQEADTDTFHVVDFKPATVKCMLQYMYTGKYEEKPPCCLNDDKNQGTV